MSPVYQQTYKLGFAVIYTHSEFRYEMSHTIASHHAHHSHQIRIPDGTLLDYMGYEFDENDVHDVKLLCETFHIEIPNEYR